MYADITDPSARGEMDNKKKAATDNTVSSLTKISTVPRNTDVFYEAHQIHCKGASQERLSSGHNARGETQKINSLQ